MSKIRTVKNQIKIEMEKFITSGDILSVEFQDFGKLPWDIDAPGYPVSIIASPNMVSEQLTNASMLRTYDFPVYLIFDADSVKEDIAGVEELLEKLMDHFDENTTMSQSFNGFVRPVTQGAMPIEGNANRVMASINLKISVETEVMQCS